MFKFIKLHITLVKYIYKEIRKKKTAKEVLSFFKVTGKAYLKVIKQECKQVVLMFNKDYRKKKSEFEKQQRLQKDLQRAVKLLSYLDKKLIKKGYNRTQIRQFWRDFEKSQQLRQDIFKELINEINEWSK